VAAEQVLHIVLGGGEEDVDPRLVEKRVEPFGGKRNGRNEGLCLTRTSSELLCRTAVPFEPPSTPII
jgi:hypothetical protein